jgi:hypothetical protein
VTLVRRIEVEIEEITTAGAVVRSGLTDRSLSIVTTGAELLTDGARVLVNPAWPLASN